MPLAQVLALAVTTTAFTAAMSSEQVNMVRTKPYRSAHRDPANTISAVFQALKGSELQPLIPISLQISTQGQLILRQNLVF